MQKKINLFDLISIGVGTIIGAGVFSMMGYGIAYTGRGICVALFLSMFLVVLQSIRYPILSSVFELDGGMYALNALVCPRVCAGFNAASDVLFKLGTQSVTALAITQYLVVLVPGLDAYRTPVAIAVLTLAFACTMVGDKFAAGVQNVMCILMYFALGLFVVYGFMNMDAAAYAGEPLFPNGFQGLMLATALMSYTCNGFQYVINMGKSVREPKKNIPLAFCLSALIAAGIYALIGFAATHAYPYSAIAGMNLGDIAKRMMPGGFYTFFVIGGALFALCTSLVGGITSGYKPLVASAGDGWLPAGLAKKSKRGIPYVLGFLYAIGVIALLLGLDLNDLVTMSLVPSGIIIIITNFFSMNVPTRYAKEWQASGVRLPAGVYRALLVLSMIASAILVVYCFLSNSMKWVTAIVTAVIFVYGYLRNKFGRIEIQAQKEYAAVEK